MAFDGTLKFDTAIDQSGFRLGLDNLGNIAKLGMSAISDVVSAATGKMTELGMNAIEVGKSFEASVSQIQATLGYSVDAVKNNINGAADVMAQLSDKAEEMGRNTAFSATQAAEGLNILAMSGYDAESSIGMIENVLNMASAGGLQLSQAASYVAGSMKGFTKEAANFADVTQSSAYYADIIAKGATLAATDVGQLGEALSQASATANTYNQSSQATEVALLRLAEQNETGSAAATALAAAMKNLYSPTDSAKKVLDELGVSAYDAQGKARDFNTVVDELYGALSQIDDEGERNNLENAIFGIQGQAAFDKMVSSSAEKVQRFYAGLDYNETGAMGSAALQAEAMLDNLNGDITLLQSAAEGLGNEVYKSLNAPLRELVQIGNSYVTEMTELLSEGGFEGLASGLGNMLASASNSISEYIARFSQIGKAVVSALADSIQEHASEIADAAVSIGISLAESLLHFTGNFLKTGVSLLTVLGDGIQHHLPELISLINEIIPLLMNSLLLGIPDIVSAGLQVFNSLANAFDAEQSAIMIASFMEIIEKIVSGIPDYASDFLKTGMLLIEKFADGVLQSLPEIAEIGISLFQQLMEGVSKNLPDIIETAKGIIPGILNSLMERISDLAQVGQELSKIMIEVISKNLPALENTGFAIISGIVDSVSENLSGFLDIGKTILQKILDAIFINLSILLNVGMWIISALANAVLDNLSEIFEIGLQILQAIAETILDNTPALKSTAESLISELTKFLSTFLPKLVSVAVEIISTLCEYLLASENLEILLNAALDIIFMITDGMMQNLSQLLDAALQIISFLCENLLTEENLELLVKAVIMILEAVVKALVDNLPLLVSATIQIMTFLCENLLTEENLELLLQASVDLVTALVDAIVNNLDDLLLAAEEIIRVLDDELTKPGNIEKIVALGTELLEELVVGLCKIGGKLAGFAWSLHDEMDFAFGRIDWAELGTAILEGIVSGLLGVDFDLDSYLKEFGNNWLTGIKEIFDINSPSKLMRDAIGKNLALGIGVGFVDEMPEVSKNVAKSFETLKTDIPESKISAPASEEFNLQLDPSALQAFRMQSASITESYFQPSATSEIVNNSYSTVNHHTETNQITENQPAGDIIIPVSIGGQNLETVVVKAIQIANARSGGRTI